LFEERVQILSELGTGTGTGTGTRPLTNSVQDQSAIAQEASTQVTNEMLTSHDIIPDLNDPLADVNASNTPEEPVFDINALIAQSQ
jgi:hypothetical protein